MPGTIPSGMHSLTPHLIVRDAAGAIEFYKKAFGAVEQGRMLGPGGKIMHAQLTIGDSKLMLVDEMPEWGAKSPLMLGGSPVTVHLYVTDADAVFAKAVEAGAVITMPIADQFWGDRYGKVRDPFGHDWSIAHHIRDVTPAQMEAAMKAMMGKM